MTDDANRQHIQQCQFQTLGLRIHPQTQRSLTPCLCLSIHVLVLIGCRFAGVRLCPCLMGLGCSALCVLLFSLGCAWEVKITRCQRHAHNSVNVLTDDQTTFGSKLISSTLSMFHIHVLDYVCSHCLSYNLQQFDDINVTVLLQLACPFKNVKDVLMCHAQRCSLCP